MKETLFQEPKLLSYSRMKIIFLSLGPPEIGDRIVHINPKKCFELSGR